MTHLDTRRINREACAWVAKLHGAEPSPETRAVFREWMAQSPQHKEEIQRVAKLWGELNVLTELAVPSQDQDLVKSSETKPYGLFPARKAIIAASVAAVFLLALFKLPYLGFNPETPEILTAVYSTAIGKQELVVLPDGSTVFVNTNSWIEIDYRHEHRQVRINKGEAHFEVLTDPARPFIVYVGDVLVRAVGTSFSVYVNDFGLEVTVSEGIVELVAATRLPGTVSEIDKEPAVLKTGQTAIFDHEGAVARPIETIAEDEIARKLSWRQGRLVFFGTPLEDVVSEVSRYTTLSIVIVDPELRDLSIGGFFEVGEAEKMLEALGSGFGVQVEYINEDLAHLTAVVQDASK